MLNEYVMWNHVIYAPKNEALFPIIDVNCKLFFITYVYGKDFAGNLLQWIVIKNFLWIQTDLCLISHKKKC